MTPAVRPVYFTYRPDARADEHRTGGTPIEPLADLAYVFSHTVRDALGASHPAGRPPYTAVHAAAAAAGAALAGRAPAGATVFGVLDVDTPGRFARLRAYGHTAGPGAGAGPNVTYATGLTPAARGDATHAIFSADAEPDADRPGAYFLANTGYFAFRF